MIYAVTPSKEEDEHQYFSSRTVRLALREGFAVLIVLGPAMVLTGSFGTDRKCHLSPLICVMDAQRFQRVTKTAFAEACRKKGLVGKQSFSPGI